jgi:hypothetical protein
MAATWSRDTNDADDDVAVVSAIVVEAKAMFKQSAIDPLVVLTKRRRRETSMLFIDDKALTTTGSNMRNRDKSRRLTNHMMAVKPD